MLIQRVNLDTFLGRDPDTIRSNLNILRSIYIYSKNHHIFANPLPHMGNFPLDYVVGMKPEVLGFQQYSNLGKYKNCLQWGSMR